VRNTFRTNTPDAMPEPKKTQPIKPGTIPDHHIPIYRGTKMVGQCGPKMTAAGVARFTGTADNHLAVRDGRTAWVSAAPKGPNKTAAAQTAKLAAHLRTDKGSNK
jgi:hypothetical protein